MRWTQFHRGYKKDYSPKKKKKRKFGKKRGSRKNVINTQKIRQGFFCKSSDGDTLSLWGSSSIGSAPRRAILSPALIKNEGALGAVSEEETTERSSGLCAQNIWRIMSLLILLNMYSKFKPENQELKLRLKLFYLIFR